MLAILVSLGTVAITHIFSEAEKPEMISNEIMERGTRLRQGIQRAYRNARSKNALKPGATRSLDIAEVVERWIPVGTSFDDAEAILKVAHFKVEERPTEAKPPKNEFWRDHPGRFAVGAKLVLDRNILSSIEVGVALYPESPFLYVQVSRVEARLVLLSL